MAVTVKLTDTHTNNAWQLQIYIIQCSAMYASYIFVNVTEGADRNRHSKICSGDIFVEVKDQDLLLFRENIKGRGITVTSQLNGVSVVFSTVCSSPDKRKHQSSASPAFVRGIHRWSAKSPHKGPVTRNMFPFDGVIMENYKLSRLRNYYIQWSIRQDDLGDLGCKQQNIRHFMKCHPSGKITYMNGNIKHLACWVPFTNMD